MQLLKEIESKKEEKMKISSRKEKFFYNFLKWNKLAYEEQKWDLDDFVISIFSKNSKNLSPKKSRKDLNFIDKIAISIYNESHDLINRNDIPIKDTYIIDKIFKENNLKIEDITDDEIPINTLIKEILWENIKINSIINAINNAEDLMDIFIIEEAFSLFCKSNHDFQNKEKYLKREHRKSLLFWTILILLIYFINIFAGTEFMINISDILNIFFVEIHDFILKFDGRIKWLGLITIFLFIIKILPWILWFIFKKEYSRKTWIKRVRDLF